MDGLPAETVDGGGSGQWSEPERGDSIGRYVVIERLGEGGMGVVYAAYDPKLDRKVAIKLIKPGADASGSRTLRLEREAQALAKLSHQAVVTVHDVGTHAERVYIAMEFVDGQTLRDWIRQGDKGKGSFSPRPWGEVVETFRRAGQGLAAAHAAGLVHRDFKPDNVMLGDDGRVRVMDFGLARAGEVEISGGTPAAGAPTAAFRSLPSAPPPGGTRTDEDSDLEGGPSHPVRSGSSGGALALDLTRPGALMGSPAYMAPEQFVGSGVSSRSDQFAFCVALYEALYGSRPFVGRSIAALAAAVGEGKVQPPPRGSSVPGWLRAVLLRGLSSSPEERFPDMDALLEGLDQGRRRRRRLGLGLAGALGAAAVAALVGVQRLDHAQRVAACEAEAVSIDAIWSAERSAGIQQRMRDTGLGYAVEVADRFGPWIDRYVGDWKESKRSACLAATVERNMDPELRARSTWCLEERRIALSSLVNSLDEVTEPKLNLALVEAIRLPAASSCTDPRYLNAMAEPPADLDRATEIVSTLYAANVAGESQDFAGGLKLVRKARGEAESLGWEPLVAAAWSRESNLLYRSGDEKASDEAGRKAYLIGARSGAWDVATAAATMLIFNVGARDGHKEGGEAWALAARAAAARSWEPLRIDEGAIEQELGNVYDRAGEYERALAQYTLSYEAWSEGLGARHPKVTYPLSNMALAEIYLGKLDEAETHVKLAQEIGAETLGAGHPENAFLYQLEGQILFTRGDLEGARRVFEGAIATREIAYGKEHVEVARTLLDYGSILATMGETEAAAAALERARRIFARDLGPEHVDVAATLTSLSMVYGSAGKLEAAYETASRALVLKRKAFGVEHHQVAESHYALGEILTEMERYEEAEVELLAAIQIGAAALGDELSANLDTYYLLLARLYVGTERPGEALPVIRKLLRVRRALGPGKTAVGEVLLAEALHGLGETGECRAALGRAIPVLESEVEAQGEDTGSYANALATARMLGPTCEGDRSVQP